MMVIKWQLVFKALSLEENMSKRRHQEEGGERMERERGRMKKRLHNKIAPLLAAEKK